MAEQIVEVLDLQPAVLDLFRNLDKLQSLGEGVILVEARQRVWLELPERIEPRDLLERNQVAHRQLERFRQQAVPVKKRNVRQRQFCLV